MIQLTDSAIRMVRTMMEQEQVAGLRLGVRGGGCSGLTYVIRFEKAPGPKDRTFEFDGAKVLVDPRSLLYLKGLTLDWKETLMEQRFLLENPNAQKSCGCGASFSP